MRPSITIVVFALLLSEAGTALQAEPLGATEEERATARRLFNEGIDLRGEGKHAAALEKFSAADRIFPTPKTRLELGRQLVAVGRLTAALVVLQSAAKMAIDPKDQAKYGPTLKEAETLAVEVAAHAPRIRVVLGAGGTGPISVDGVAQPQGITEIRVDPGAHIVTARVDGAAVSRTVSATEKQVVVADFATPGSSVKPESTDAPSRESTRADPPTLAVGLFVGAGVGVLGGLGLGYWAKTTKDDANPHCGIGGNPDACDAEGMSLRHSAGTRADLATGAFVIGAAAAAAGLVVWWLAPTPAAPRAVGVAIQPTGITVVGRF